jgi:hypothetical protein
MPVAFGAVKEWATASEMKRSYREKADLRRQDLVSGFRRFDGPSGSDCAFSMVKAWPVILGIFSTLPTTLFPHRIHTTPNTSPQS